MNTLVAELQGKIAAFTNGYQNEISTLKYDYSNEVIQLNKQLHDQKKDLEETSKRNLLVMASKVR